MSVECNIQCLIKKCLRLTEKATPKRTKRLLKAERYFAA